MTVLRDIRRTGKSLDVAKQHTFETTCDDQKLCDKCVKPISAGEKLVVQSFYPSVIGRVHYHRPCYYMQFFTSNDAKEKSK